MFLNLFQSLFLTLLILLIFFQYFLYFVYYLVVVYNHYLAAKIVDHGGGEPNSDERREAIKNMMKNIGGKAVRREQEKKLKQAKTAVKQILKKKK